MNNNKLVNGPINAFRLEGKIGNINKVIYLFGDYHVPINAETKCDSFISDDFVSYFIKTMEKTDKNIRYDFFCENYSNVDMFEGYKYSDSPYRQQYLRELIKYVNIDVNLTDKDKKIKNNGSKTFKNLRLHYLDIRSFFGKEKELTTEIIYLLDNFIENPKMPIIDALIIKISNLKNHIIYLSNHLNKILNNDKSIVDKIKIADSQINIEIEKYLNIIKSEEPRMMQYSEKMLKKYKNTDVNKKILKSDLLENIFQAVNIFIKKSNSCIKKLQKIKELGKISLFELNEHENQREYNYGPDYTKIKKIFYQVILKYEILDYYYTKIYSWLTDIYLLRRILDKDYVEHAIIYTGMLHAQNYIYTLIKYFGFTITNLEYSKLSIKETNEIIPKMQLNELSELLNKPKFKQCTDMSKFPENFL
jgi:hypothetical protein